MSEPLLPTLGVDFDDTEEVILGQYDPRPPGKYRATIDTIEKTGENLRVNFRLQSVVSLVDGATPPKTLGVVGTTFWYMAPIPTTASADERKKRRNAQGIFKGFYRVATGQSLTGASIDWTALKAASLIVSVSWSKRATAPGQRPPAYSYQQWLMDGKPAARDTFYENVSGFFPAQSAEPSA